MSSVQVMQSLPTSKAAFLQGLTCELVKCAARPVEIQSAGDTDGHDYESQALVDCIAHVIGDVMLQQAPTAMTSLPETKLQVLLLCLSLWHAQTP